MILMIQNARTTSGTLFDRVSGMGFIVCSVPV
jgi:hypothetical protein